jgi:hypothetical protein
MKMSNNNWLSLSGIFLLIHLNVCGQKLLDNHIEAVEQFSRVKSKSKSLASYAKRSLAGQPALDSVELMYMDLKEASDGAIGRYKSIIDNPNLAKKNEANITDNLNEMNTNLNTFSKFISSKARPSMGFQQMNPIGLLTSFTGLGGSLIKEIGDMQKSKKDVVKKELDEYKLDDWVEIQ